jgi:hypothetical protein
VNRFWPIFSTLGYVIFFAEQLTLHGLGNEIGPSSREISADIEALG